MTPLLIRYLPPFVLGLFAMTTVHADTKSSLGECQFDTLANQWWCQTFQADTTIPSQAQLNLDWLPADYLNNTTKESLGVGCSGAYIDPLRNQTLEDAAINTLPLVVEAQTAEVIEASTATLDGAVRVSQGPRSIAADHMSYERTEDKASLRGHVSIRQPGMLIRGESASVSTTEHQGEFSEARFVMHDMHMRGAAELIKQDAENRIILKGGAISSCEPDSKAWSLEGQELGVDKEKGQGYGKNVRLKLGGVPVFYLPYISFPVGDERRSGFLFPSISSSDDGGLDVSVPYYLNLAPNYDLTLTPRLITGRGAMIEAETHHLNQYFLSELGGSYLGNDSGGSLTTEDGEEPLNQHAGSNRWLVQLKQTGGRRSGWYSNINYTKTSDTDYFRDLGTSSFSVSNTTYLDQSIDGGVSLKNWNLYAKIQDYQTLLLNLDAPYRKVPELAANGIYELANLQFSLRNNLTRFDHRDSVRLDGSPDCHWRTLLR